MKKTPDKILVALAVPGILGLSLDGWTRQVEDWAYERLFHEADLVVIARAVSSEPCADLWKEDIFEAERFRGQETTFEITSALKGEPPAKLTLLHFRYKSGVRPYNDGPGLVSFLMDEVAFELEVKRKHEEPDRVKQLAPGLRNVVSPAEYLLFLKQNPDGRFEAASGQVDPDFSVRLLLDPGIFQ